MEKVKLISNGTIEGTKIIRMGENGDEIKIPLVVSANYNVNVNGVGKLTMEIISPVVEIEADGEYIFQEKIFNEMSLEQLEALKNILVQKINSKKGLTWH